MATNLLDKRDYLFMLGWRGVGSRREDGARDHTGEGGEASLQEESFQGLTPTEGHRPLEVEAGGCGGAISLLHRGTS